MLGTILRLGRAAPPTTFSQLFATKDEFRWGHGYSKPTSTSALWENEGLVAGWDATEQTADAALIPFVGSFAGSPFPWFESLNSNWDGLWTAANFDGLDDEDEITAYGAFSTLGVDEGAADFSLMTQAGRLNVYLWWGADDRLHLRASINNGDQWSDDDPESIVDDRAVHTWVLTLRSNGTAKLFLDGVQIGAEVTGLTGAFAGVNTNRLRFGRNQFEGPMGGLYLNGIATKGLNDIQVGYLFTLINAYVGSATAPNVTGTTPAQADEGDTITVDGTGFVNGALVFFRQNGGAASSWVLGDNISFVSATAIDVDVPNTVPDGDVDIMVINPTALYDSELSVFTKGPVVTITSLLYAAQGDTEGGEFTQLDGSGFQVGTGTSNVWMKLHRYQAVRHFSVPADNIVWMRSPSAPTEHPYFTPASNSYLESVGANGQAAVYGSSGTLVFLFYAYSAPTDTGNATPYQEANLLCNPDGVGTRLGVGVTSAGFRAGYYDGSSWDSRAIACSLGQLHVGVFRWNGTNASISVDGGAWTTWAMSAPALIAADLMVGRSQFSATTFHGGIGAVIGFNSHLSDVNVANIVAGLAHDHMAEWAGVTPALFDYSTLSPTLMLAPGTYAFISPDTWYDASATLLDFVSPVAPPDPPLVRRLPARCRVITMVDGIEYTCPEEWVYWDPAAEPSCATLLERGGYGETIGSPGGNYGLKWTCRKDISGTIEVANYDAGDAEYAPLDDTGKEPRHIGSLSLNLSDDVRTLTHFCGLPALSEEPITVATGYRCPNNPAPQATVVADTAEPLLNHQGLGTEFSTSHSSSGFGAEFYDNGAGTWRGGRAAAPPNAQNIGVITYDPLVEARVRANGGAWVTEATSGNPNTNYDLPMYFCVNYTASFVGNSTTRFAMFARGVWSEAQIDRLDLWYAYRHGGNRQNTDYKAPNAGELWYVTSDVIHTTPKRVTIKGKGLNVAGLVVLFLTDDAIGYASEVAIHDDNTISCLPPSGAGFTGHATVMVFGTALHAQLVNAVQYVNPIGSDRSPVAWWRPSASLRTTSGSNPVVVTQVRDFFADTSRYMNGPAGGNFASGASAPRFFDPDIRFGKEPTLGGRPAELRSIGHGTPAAPQAGPVTIYSWMQVGPHRATVSPRTLYMLNDNGTDTSGFPAYFSSGAGGGDEFVMSGSGHSSATALDGKYGQAVCLATTWGGASSELNYASVNNWLKGDTNASGANRTETALAIGNYPGEIQLGWRWSARLMFSGRDSYALRRMTVRWGENFFQVGNCDLDKFPDLVACWRPGDYTDQYTGVTNTRAWFPSGGSVTEYNPAHALIDIAIAGSTTPATVEEDGVPLFWANGYAMGTSGGLAITSCMSNGANTGDMTMIMRCRFGSGGITRDAANGWENDNLWMDSGGYIGGVAKRTGSPGSYQYWVGTYGFCVGAPATGYVAWADITSLVDANGEGEVTVAFTKVGASLYTYVNGTAVAATPVVMVNAQLNSSGFLRVHGPYNTFHCKTRAILIVKRGLSGGELYYLDRTLR
jgi:hypothetical protein